MIEIAPPKFDLGKLVSTPGAIEALNDAEQSPVEFISRHIKGDWGLLRRRLSSERRRPAEWRPAVLRLSNRERREDLDHHRGGSEFD